MPIINPADLATNIYAEIITEITRTDNTITTRAIDAAVAEAKMYLDRYDLLQLFGSSFSRPSFRDEYLVTLVKDLACWHLIRLSNTGVDYTVYRTAYMDAIAALKQIQSAQAQPQGWPYKADTSPTVPDGNIISWSSNAKRENFY